MNIALLGTVAILCAAAEGHERVVDLSVWAVEAVKEGRESKYFEPELAPIRQTVEDLPYDTYRAVCITRRMVSLGENARIPVGQAITFCVTPQSIEEDGRVRLNLAVQLAPKKEGDKPVKALETTLLAVPGKKIKLQGFKRGDAELVIIFAAQPAEGDIDREHAPATKAE